MGLFLFCRDKDITDNFTNYLQNLNTPQLKRIEAINAAQKKWQKIPLQQKSYPSIALYVSALPKSISKAPSNDLFCSLQKTTERITQLLNQSQLIEEKYQSNPTDRFGYFDLNIWREFEITTQRPGWIAFQLSNRGLALWLQRLQTFDRYQTKIPPSLEVHPYLQRQKSQRQESQTQELQRQSQTALPDATNGQTSALANDSTNRRLTGRPTSSNGTKGLQQEQQWLWQAQYTHARCMSLLRHWQQQSTSIQDSIENDQHRRKLPDDALQESPVIAPVPWLTKDQQVAIRTPKSQHLIQTLVEVVDAMFWIPYQYQSNQYFLLLQHSAQLCQAFEQFYRSDFIRASSALRTSSVLKKQQIQVQAGLIKATQTLLNALLVNYFDEAAPSQL
ncbi:MAG: hypothetical protein AAFY72_17225 [Cyanobacteria bacterium J06649_4]